MTGSFQKLTQVTRMANVRNMSPFLQNKNLKPANLKPAPFRGAIVALGKLEDRNYKAIPESYFKVNEPCSAQQAVTGKAKYSDAQRLTGVCHPVKGVTGGWVLVKWDSSGETQWLPHYKVMNRILEEKRSRASTAKVDDNDRPQTQKDIQRVDIYYSPFVSFKEIEQEEKDKKAKGMVWGKGNNNVAVEPTGSVANDNKPTKSVAPEKVLDEGEGGNKLEIELHGKIKEQIPTPEQLEQMGRDYWNTIEIMKIMGRENANISSQPRPPPEYKTINLSFTYDILRGDIPGRLPQMDSALKITLKEHLMGAIGGPSVYIGVLCDSLLGLNMRKREKKHANPICKVVPICKAVGCKSQVHSVFWEQGLCYSHGPKERKECINCKGRTASRLGKLCRICFNNSSGEEKGKVLCRVCGARTPRKIGGRCEHCVIDKKTG